MIKLEVCRLNTEVAELGFNQSLGVDSHWSSSTVILSSVVFLTLVCRFCMDFSNVLGGALWWLHRMATALLALL